ncbi:MAG TPA: glutamate--tRNA ligase [Acidimicrobiales bacterium]|nr:glutamate--tRNA ligase [Acidimicrobiales bacterium]
MSDHAATTAPVRVRFAPSPTGYFHVGGARTALYNLWFARQHGGTFVLRIEDTDRERSQESWTEGILAALSWIEVDWDEGPYLQSERAPLYSDAAARLYAAGRCYYCECRPEDVRRRTEHNATPGYDGYCRGRGLGPGPGRALRFAVPDEGVTVVHDLVRGDVEFPNSSIEDFVIVKSNGDALFVLAVVVDDQAMGITHVIRAEEHLPTTPKQVLMWPALSDRPVPSYAHLPVLVNEQRRKLSKRVDRVAVEDYRDLGYLPEAMVNYLGILGWSPKDGREILSRGELEAEFRLEDVNHSPAFFDEKRLENFNGLYIRALPAEEFVRRCLDYRPPPEVAVWPPEGFDLAVFERLAPLVQERVETLSKVPGYVEFVFAPEPFEPDEKDFAKVIAADSGAAELLAGAIERLAALDWSAEAIRAQLTELAEESGRKLAKAQAPVRVASMGRSVGLPLFESLEVLGRDRTLARLEAALRRAARRDGAVDGVAG